MQDPPPLFATRQPSILVVEDEFLVALALEGLLEAENYLVVGPVSTLDSAMSAMDQKFDLALLDVNLNGDMSYPVARTLIAKGIPVVLMSGYSSHLIPAEFCSIPKLNKPYAGREILKKIRELLPVSLLSSS